MSLSARLGSDTQYQSAVLTSGVVTLIAARRYIRIFTLYVCHLTTTAKLVVTGNVGPRFKRWYNSVVALPYSDQG